MLDFCGLRGSKHIYLYLPLYLHDLYWTLGQRPHCVLLYHKLLKPTKGVEIVPNNKLWLARKVKTDINRKIAFYSGGRERNSQNILKLL